MINLDALKSARYQLKQTGSDDNSVRFEFLRDGRKFAELLIHNFEVPEMSLWIGGDVRAEYYFSSSSVADFSKVLEKLRSDLEYIAEHLDELSIVEYRLGKSTVAIKLQNTRPHDFSLIQKLFSKPLLSFLMKVEKGAIVESA